MIHGSGSITGRCCLFPTGVHMCTCVSTCLQVCACPCITLHLMTCNSSTWHKQIILFFKINDTRSARRRCAAVRPRISLDCSRVDRYPSLLDPWVDSIWINWTIAARHAQQGAYVILGNYFAAASMAAIILRARLPSSRGRSFWWRWRPSTGAAVGWPPCSQHACHWPACMSRPARTSAVGVLQ